MFQAYSAIFTTLDIIRLIYPHSDIFWEIQNQHLVDLEYLEPMAYSGILRTVNIFSQFQASYSGITQEQFIMYVLNYSGRFRHIQNSCLFRHVMFHAYSGAFTKLRLSRNICPHSGMHQQILACQDPCIIGPNSVNQHLLFKSGSSFKSLFKSFWNIVPSLFQNQTLKIFSSGYYFNNNNNNNMPPTLERHSHYSRKHTTHPYSRQHVTLTTHANQHAFRASTPPTPTTLAYHPRKYATHATQASTLPTQAMLARAARHFSNSFKNFL